MSLGQDGIEEILIRLPIKSLLKFKQVSKTWKSTIESGYFKKKHLKLQKPDLILMVEHDVDDGDGLQDDGEELRLRTLVYDNGHHPELLVEQDGVSLLQVPFDDVSKSIDGLICFYNFRGSICVVNPSIRWYLQVPQATIQAFVNERYEHDVEYEPNLLGFGKDKRIGTYKLVWLYNVMESEIPFREQFILPDQEVATTTCEVFDFNTSLWRQVESPRYRIFDHHPIYFDGSLHWLVFEPNSAIKILSFDCHTEIFRMISESPITQEDETQVMMSNLNNRLCVSEKKWPRQDIWTLNSSNMTWEKIYSLDLSSCHNGLIGDEMWPIASLIAILKKKVFLLDETDENRKLVIYDLETRSYSLSYIDVESVILNAPYLQSLISIT